MSQIFGDQPIKTQNGKGRTLFRLEYLSNTTPAIWIAAHDHRGLTEVVAQAQARQMRRTYRGWNLVTVEESNPTDERTLPTLADIEKFVEESPHTSQTQIDDQEPDGVVISSSEYREDFIRRLRLAGIEPGQSGWEEDASVGIWYYSWAWIQIAPEKGTTK